MGNILSLRDSNACGSVEVRTGGRPTGFSPTRYLIRARIDKMKVLLKQNPSLSVKTITSLIGIEDPLYVSKLFKKETGMSVSEYKNTCKN